MGAPLGTFPHRLFGGSRDRHRPYHSAHQFPQRRGFDRALLAEGAGGTACSVGGLYALYGRPLGLLAKKAAIRALSQLGGCGARGGYRRRGLLYYWYAAESAAVPYRRATC